MRTLCRGRRYLLRELSYRVLRMPPLSPTTLSAAVQKWYVKEGETVSSYDLALRVHTLNLTTDFNKPDKIEGEREGISLDIEIIEDCTIAKILVHAETDRQVKVGAPLAILSDEEMCENSVMNFKWREVLDQKTTTNALWQAYLVSGGDECGSCG